MNAVPVSRPVVGISTYREQAQWGVWDEVADVVHAAYTRAVEAAGGAVVLLPPADPAMAADVVGRLDALVIAGGADVGPERYDAEPHPRTGGVRPGWSRRRHAGWWRRSRRPSSTTRRRSRRR